MNNKKDQNDLIDYTKMVRELREYNSKNVFPNKGYDHASIVLSNIFEEAKKEVNILTADFGKGKIDDSLVDSINIFLANKEAKLNIVYTGNIEDNDKIKDILTHSNVSKHKAKAEKLKDDFLKGSDYHFTVGDNKMYRFETNVNEQTAICSFNNDERAKGLNNLFNRIVSSLK